MQVSVILPISHLANTMVTRSALVLSGSALDPPTMGIKISDFLKVQYAHLNMFFGLRVQELTKGDFVPPKILGKSPVLAAPSLTQMATGNVYASTKETPSKNTPTTSEA